MNFQKWELFSGSPGRICSLSLKEKSGVGIIVDYSRDYTVMNTFFNFFSFNLRNYTFQSAKKCEMTSFHMMSILPPHCQPHYRAFAHKYKIQNGDAIWPSLQ